MVGKIVGKLGQERYYLDGRVVSAEQFLAAFPDQPLGGASALVDFKPILSDALAVHPKQVEEARRDALAKGVPTEFLPDGRPVLRSRAHRKAYLRAYRFHDRNGGYGD